MTAYVTVERDMLDAVCKRHYGYSAGVTELVLKHNPGLAERGPVYPAGVEIVLPVVVKPSEQTTRPKRLWD